MRLTLIDAAHSVLSKTAVLAIRSYQAGIRPLLIGQCKFCPSCSQYAIEAIQQWGIRKGGWLAVKRLGCCHPFTPGGVDPVPQPSQNPPTQQSQKTRTTLKERIVWDKSNAHPKEPQV